MRTAAEKAITMFVVINNRFGGSAPMIAGEIVRGFLSAH